MKNIHRLGKITKIDLRKAWKHEASDFTAWLAEKENLQLLSDEVGIDMSLVQIEAPVGRYSNNTDEWEKYFAWMLETGEKFQQAFSQVRKKYKDTE